MFDDVQETGASITAGSTQTIHRIVNMYPFSAQTIIINKRNGMLAGYDEDVQCVHKAPATCLRLRDDRHFPSMAMKFSFLWLNAIYRNMH